jgi:hypothetical protein
VALALGGASGQIFMVLYALLFVGVSALHMLSLRQLVRAV